MYEVDIEKLLNKTGSTYKLVVLTTMRAIELSDGAARLVAAAPEIKTINVALQEISEGKITYKTKEKEKK
ncbi:MAG: DNA-directed RNA polymerase subunit omega [Candidatus Omnitrophica bacterium]|nr:DNA-directed RNA polymerase subunit omega [Candidatus Omnitrophota bacterium]